MESFWTGFFGMLLIGFILTPIITVGIVINILVKKAKNKKEYNQQIFERQQKQQLAVEIKKKDINAVPKIKKNIEQTSMADELYKLKGLLDNGLLNEKEFQKLKEDLLSK